ncbi:PTS transporter subunit EIIC [Amphibacillus sp. Q70]|uniref:PTS transporter subunit EIIC n=1 Tax=Amphibacillus sp. Q70 TaxID=3453416 RepID=UPI003F85EE11
MNNKKLAKEIVELLGNKENISTFLHCVTRLRFNLVNNSKADLEKIEKLDGVIGTQIKNGQYQVIIGPNVGSVFSEVEAIIGKGKDNTKELTTNETKFSLDFIFDIISGVFSPILPALVAGGILKGIIAIVLSFNTSLDGNSTISLFNLIADIPFYFLPFLLAISSARKFKLNEYLGVCMAGALLYPSFVATIESGQSGLTLFNLTIPVFNYANSVFPVILGVGLMALVYKFIDRYVPEVLKMVVVPSITLIVAIPIAMFIIAPIGAYGGIYLADGIVWLFDKAGILAGFLLGFFMPLIVLAGMHQSTSPIQIQNISTLGYDYLLPISFCHNMAESGAALGAGLRMKDKEMRSAAISTSFSAFLGISEPALYTVNVVNKTPLISAMIANGIGGALTVVFATKCFAFVMPGITSLPVYAEPGGGLKNLFLMILCILSTFAISFILSFVSSKKMIGNKRVDVEKEVKVKIV